MVTLGFPRGTSGKECDCQCRRCKGCGFDPWVRKIPWRRNLAWRILAWRIPWTEEPDSLQHVGSQRAGHGWATKHTEGYQILHQKLLGFRNNVNPMLLVPEFASFQYVGSESPNRLCRQISFVYTAWKWKSLSHVTLLVAPWVVACQVPLSMGFSRQE